ncbi:imidazolonepropionase [Flavobacteriales bacterium]|nr:imidazolonepropionase [Flavobacteriales bacterium]
MKTAFINISELQQVREEAMPAVGKAMAELPSIKDAYLIIENDLIVEYGAMDDYYNANYTQVDCTGRMIFPSFCDSHTHLVYAGSREVEFQDKIKGLSYEEIAANGGGILNSAKRLHDTSEDDLVEQAFKRLEEIKMMGTGAVEIKSGYGLSVEDEIKMLRVIKRLRKMSPLTIKSTFLGAHAIPTEYKKNRDAYVDLIINEMLPIIKEEELAEYVDVFCDRGFFTVEETDRILQAGSAIGLRAKIHANELDYSGGIQVGVKNNALSVDHLECTGDEEIAILGASETMPTLLPSTAFYLKLHYPPARKIIDAGLPVAMATDYNPGSSPSGKMTFILSLASIHMKMLPEEGINAVTLNSAYAMDVLDTHGSITVGKKASFFITNEIPSVAFIPYSFGSNLIDEVYIEGVKQ